MYSDALRDTLESVPIRTRVLLCSSRCKSCLSHCEREDGALLLLLLFLLHIPERRALFSRDNAAVNIYTGRNAHNLNRARRRVIARLVLSFVM